MTDLAPSAPVVDGAPRRFRWTPGLRVGVALGALVVLVAVLAPPLLRDAAETLTNDANLPVSGDHWLGTDSFGRDMLARSLVATRLTLLMTLAATAISVVVGVLLGAGIWLAPRRVREAGLRVIEVAVSYPGLLVALVISAILGAGVTAVVLAIGLSNIPAFARLTANLASSVSRREFVQTARLLGVPGRTVLRRHLLPNIAEPLLVLVASSFAVGLMEISGLSFVGLGVQSPQYDFGKLLADALPEIYSRPVQVVGPAAMIVLTALAAMLIGDGLAAAADPRAARAGRSLRARSVPVRPVLPATDDDALVAVQDLVVTRADGHPLVRGISFRIGVGEVLGVVGESGSGKSLTAMALARLLPDGLTAQAAELRLDDMDLRGRVPAGRLATTLALVYQDPGTTFNPALRMGSQLGEVLVTHTHRSRPDVRHALVDALRAVRMTQPERRLQQHPHELSGGMRQRAMIAAALAAEPRLIIADEPTTALDVTVQAEILRELRRINRERRTAMLFISHDLGVVEALCHRVLVMRDGEVVEELTAAQLASGDVHHPYTRQLLAATPRLTDPLPDAPRGAHDTLEVRA